MNYIANERERFAREYAAHKAALAERDEIEQAERRLDRIYRSADYFPPAPAPAPAPEPVTADVRETLSRFRATAVIDTMALDFQIARSGRIATLKAVVGGALGIAADRVFIEAMTDEDRRSHSSGWGVGRFRLVVQDPTRDSLWRVVRAIEREWGLVGEVEIGFIDVAVDFRLKGLDKRRKSRPVTDIAI